MRAVIEQARKAGHALLFIDEIHRFNKAQQDSLLGAVEKGVITLIGATTENPSFEVISALLSRSQVYVLQSLTEENLKALVAQAMGKDEWLKQQHMNNRGVGGPAAAKWRRCPPTAQSYRAHSLIAPR